MDALKHPYFFNPPLPARPGEIPPFEDSHELDRRKFRGQKAALPPAPAGGSVGMGPNGEWTSGSGVRAPIDGKSSRIPSAARPGNISGPPSARRPYDNRPPEPLRGHKRKASAEPPGQHQPAWKREANLPPKPPAPANPPAWQSAQNWRGGGPNFDQRRDRPPRSGRGGDGRSSYVPNYGNPNDRPRDGPMHSRRDNWRPSRSRSPDMRDRHRPTDHDASYHTYRR